MSSVWVQLYYEHEERVEIQDNCVDIEIAEIPNGNISGLARRLCENDMKNDLSHCDRGRIRVYPPGTRPPFSQANSTGKGKPLKEVIEELKNTPPTSCDHPLVVVAPAPPNHWQPGIGMAKRVQENLKNSVCLFVDEDEPLGCGFAVSADTVYTCAHHWLDPTLNKLIVSEGSEVKCYYGKQENNQVYTMKITKVDEQLDYCVLVRQGDAPFPDFLQIVDSDLPELTPVFLVAYQIGLNTDLKAFDLDKGLGFSPGHIIKKGRRHFLHSCPAFKGDSGGAIVISGGQVVGIHLESVNEFQKKLDMDSLELASVAVSVEDLIQSHHSGCVALLPSAVNT